MIDFDLGADDRHIESLDPGVLRPFAREFVGQPECRAVASRESQGPRNKSHDFRALGKGKRPARIKSGATPIAKYHVKPGFATKGEGLRFGKPHSPGDVFGLRQKFPCLAQLAMAS